MADSLVFLVPGFFRLTPVGAVSGFAAIERALDHALRKRGVKARTVCCISRPRASIPRGATAAEVAAAIVGVG